MQKEKHCVVMLLEMYEIVMKLRNCIIKIVTSFRTLRFEEIMPVVIKRTDSVCYGQMQMSKEVNDKFIMFAPYSLLLITVNICVYLH